MAQCASPETLDCFIFHMECFMTSGATLLEINSERLKLVRHKLSEVCVCVCVCVCVRRSKSKSSSVRLMYLLLTCLLSAYANFALYHFL